MISIYNTVFDKLNNSKHNNELLTLKNKSFNVLCNKLETEIQVCMAGVSTMALVFLLYLTEILLWAHRHQQKNTTI